MSVVSMQEAIEIIKSDSDNLKRVMEYYGTIVTEHNNAICPFHSDKNPSLGIKGNHYKCFTVSCGASGDAIDFVRAKEGLDVVEAIKTIVDILGINITIEKDKLDNLREYIEKNNKTHYKDKDFKFEDVYFYHDKNNIPILARIKFKNPVTSKKKFSQANIIDGDYYKLDFKKESEKHNLIYNMPSVIKSIQENRYIFLLEGEKDVKSLKRLGFTATTCREINSVTDEVLVPLYYSRLVVIGDNDIAGKIHVDNVSRKLKKKVKQFKVPYFKTIYDLGEKADISDYIDSCFEKGLSTNDIRKIILDVIDRTLDQKDENELQQDYGGIYQTNFKYDKEGELIDTQKIYITNFNIISLTRIENIDTDEEIIELKIKSMLGETKTVKGRSNKIFLDPKSFNSFMNMAFAFDGNARQLTRFKNWANRYFLIEKRNEYRTTGIRLVDGKRMLLTNTGAMLEDGSVTSDYKADNELTNNDLPNIKRMTKEQSEKLKKHLFKFNTEKNVYNVLGSVVSKMVNSVYRETKGVNLHVTSIVGESGSGKTFTIDNIIRPLLLLENDCLTFSTLKQHGVTRSINDTYMPLIIDEVKPSQSSEYLRKLLSNTIRQITGSADTIKGNADQSFNRYKNNASLIIAGEEVIEETAVKNRCNIIWFSCQEMNKEHVEHGEFFLTKEGKEALNSLGYEIYLEILNNWNSDRLLAAIENIKVNYTNKYNVNPRIESTVVNCVIGLNILKKVLNVSEDNLDDILSTSEVVDIIHKNIKENVLDGEYATKQIYEEILEAIDELASGTGQYSIAEDLHYKQDSLYLKLDFKSIFPVLESYYRNRGKTLSIDCKTFVKMITRSKYVEGLSKDYYKSVRIGEKIRKVYFIKKETLNELDMQTLIPKNEVDWEEV